jgi:hypothetical protein
VRRPPQSVGARMVGFGWRLHGHWELMVSEKESAIESIPKSDPHLEVTVCEPQGEPE